MAHHVSAIAIQAQAGRALAATSPSSALEALEVIEEEASRTLAEMRTMVRVLRNETPADYAPQPGVADLERLAAAASTGPRVHVTLSGDLAQPPRGDGRSRSTGSPRRPSRTPCATHATPRWSPCASTATSPE